MSITLNTPPPLTDSAPPWRIVFHGGAARFAEGFAALLDFPAEILSLPDPLGDESQRQTYASADVIVAFNYRDPGFPADRLKLFQIPGTGLDGLDLNAFPPSAVVCNTHGHGPAIAEYVFAALLLRQIPLIPADRDLRDGDWTYLGGTQQGLHGELADATLGLLGYGHIGQALARRAKAFEMQVHVANRSPVPISDCVDRSFGLKALPDFCAALDYLVVALPLTPETTALLGPEAFAAMPSRLVIVNVGRGHTIDETALFTALQTGRIAGAVIDTWYQYTSGATPRIHPSELPFHTLPNVTMTPHMSAWTHGTLRRRQQAIAANVRRLRRGEPCQDVVRPPMGYIP